jgi:SH3 domain protein
MRWVVFIGVCLCFFAAAGHAEETMYIHDSISHELGLREEPDSTKKVSEIIEAGPVEVLKKEDKWSYIRLSNGKEGWVLSRYIKSKKPISVELQEMKESRKKYDKISEQIAALNDEIKRLKAENEKLASESVEKLKKIKELSNSYSTLKMETAEAQKVKPPEPASPPPKNEPKNEFQNKPKADLIETVRNLEMNDIVKGALVGVGILLVGYLMGSISRGQKRRSSYF